MAQPSPLSPTARAVLTAAAAHPKHLATPPALPVAAQRAVMASLLKAGLLAQVPVPGRDSEQVLGVTGAGLAAIGADPSEAPRTDGEGTAAAERQSTGVKPADTAASARTGLRGAAQAVVVAWGAQSPPAALSAAVERLRTALARKPATPASTGPRSPRTGSKQATVLALLHRAEGATVAQVMEATGWAPHTVRGFLAGLKRRGTPVEVLERVRQVGPGKAGAKGSYSIYRLAEAG